MRATEALDQLRAAVTPLLAALALLKELPGEGHWVFKRDGNGCRGSVETKISWVSLIQQNQKTVDELEPAIKQWVSTYYPGHSGSVGTSMMGFGPIQHHALLWTIATEIYDRHGSFRFEPEQLDAVLTEVITFFESDCYQIDIFAVALNLQGPDDLPPIPFPGGLTLRPITNAELTRFYGGNPFFKHRSMPTVTPQFVFVTQLRLPKEFGAPSGGAPSPWDAIFASLDRSVLALATFKEAGAAGYDGIRYEPRGITVGGAVGMTYRSQEMSTSPFQLAMQDVAPLTEHIRRFADMHSTLEIACQRLVDATRRAKPRDVIMDSVIGLESILLTGINTESSFRFALNYSTLVPNDRRAAYEVAKSLYGLRSKIAHGSSLSEPVAFAGKKLSLHEVANIALVALRLAISKFIGDAKLPPFVKDGGAYWVDLHTR